MASEWLLDAVRFFRALDFFSEYEHLADEELADQLSRLQRERSLSGNGFEPDDWFEDIVLLSHDKDRVWWRDLEADVFPGENACIRTLKEWARISRDTFRPEHITETWEGDESPVVVTFELDGRTYRLDYEFDEWIPTEWVTEIDQLIAPTGYQFESPPTGDQTAVLIVLTAEEKALIERERSWKFDYDPSMYED